MDKHIKHYVGFWDRINFFIIFALFPKCMALVDRNGKPIKFRRRLLRFVLACAPLIIYILLTYIYVKSILYFLPLIVIACIIDWTPFFFKRYKRPLHDILSGVHVVYSEGKTLSPLPIIFKRPLFAISITSMLIIGLTAIWVTYNIPDRPLNPEVEAFFYENDYKLENNVRIAWAGFHAPAGTKDIYDYGLKIHNGEIDNTKYLEFTESELRKYMPEEMEERINPPKGYITSMYLDNKEIIDRYISLYEYKNYGIDNTLAGYIYGQDFIYIHKFLPLYWEYMAKNSDGDKAIKWWLKDMKLIQEMMGSYSDMVDKAIWMVQYSLNLTALPLILRADPTLIKKYEQPIKEMIGKDFLSEIWNVKDTWRAEYNMFRDIKLSELPNDLLTIKPNDTRNEFLKLVKEMIWLSEQPYKDIPNAYEIIKEKYNCTEWYCFSYNIGKKLLFGGFIKGGEMYLKAHSYTSRQNALILWMEAKSKGLTHDEMPDFLSQAPKNLYNKMTDKPFQWDDANKAIYFLSDINGPETRQNLIYNHK